MKGFTTIAVKPEISQELGELQKELKMSKHKIIENLMLIRKEFIRMRGKKEYISLVNSEKIKEEEFMNKIDFIKTNIRLLHENQKLFYQMLKNMQSIKD